MSAAAFESTATPADCGVMLFSIDADGTFEAIGFAGADIVAIDGEIIEVLAARERKQERKRNCRRRIPATHDSTRQIEARYSRAVISRVRTPFSSTYHSPMIISILGVIAA